MDVGFTISIGLLSIIPVLWFIWRKRRMSLFERLGIPGPKPHLITGNVNNSSQQADLSVEWEKKYGKFYGVFMGGWPFLVISDTELLKKIQIKEFKTFSGRAKFLGELAIAHPFAHEGMFTQDGENWKKMRSAISPAFTTGKLKMMMPIATEAIDIFLKKIGEQGQKTFDIVPLIRRVSFDINSRASFGISTGIQNNDESIFIRSVYRSFDADSSDFLAKLLVYFPELEPFPQLIRILRDKIRTLLNVPSVTAVMKSCAEIIKMRKDNPQAERPDLLQGLINASGDHDDTDSVKKGNPTLAPLTENEVIANAYGFMLAGFDAINVILSFCIHYIVEYPEVQEKLREEIKANVTGKVDYDCLSKLTYLDQVINETLRVFPFSFIGINRTSNEDYKYKGVTIPKGMNIGLAIYALNMNPEHWEEPEKFNPERFSPDNEKYIDTTVYQPFGLGPRNCVGMRFAQVVMKAAIASLIQNYKLVKPADAKAFELSYTVFLIRPTNGVEIQAIPI